MAGRAVDRTTGVRVSFTDEGILRALLDFHYLTAEQLTRFRYSPTSLNYAREQLKRLYDWGFVDRTYGPRSQAAGSTPWVYFLAKRAYAHFREQDIEMDRRHRPSEQRSRSDPFLFHTLAINDFLIAARLLERHVAGLTLAAFRHDLDLKRNPIKLETGMVDSRTGEKELESVSPDAWVDFRVTAPGRNRPVTVPLLLELDRDTEPVRRVKRKVRGLLAYIAGPYKQIFGTSYVTVVFAVDEGACRSREAAHRRAAELQRWIEETLREQGKESWASLFLITTLARGQDIDSVDLFLGKHALGPFSQSPLSLLDLPLSGPITGTDGQSTPFPASAGMVR